MKKYKLIGYLFIIISIVLINIKKINKLNKDYKTEIFLKQFNNLGNIINSEYYLVLEIPKISLKQGVYPIDNSLNTIEKNIEILSNDESNIILAAHSGNSVVSYFSNLYKLKIGDELYIYKNKKTKYIINNIYTILKNEEYINNTKSNITLITCFDDYKYLIIEGIYNE